MERSLSNSFAVMIRFPSRKNMKAVTEWHRELRSMTSGVKLVRKMLTALKTYTVGKHLVWTLPTIAHGIQVFHAYRLTKIQIANLTFGPKGASLRGRKIWTGLSRVNAPHQALRHIYDYTSTKSGIGQ